MQRLALRYGACLLLAAPVAQAEPRWGGSVTLANDHLLRGVSRSSGDPALSAEWHVQGTGGWFGSLWASTSRVRPADSTTVELSATLGVGLPLGRDWAMRGSYTHYESPWQTFADFYRYDEVTLDLRYREAFLVSASFSPNTSRYASAHGLAWEGNALAVEAAVQRELLPRLRAHAGAGYYDLSDLFGEGYWYGSVGLGWAGRRWQLDASWVFTDAAASRLSYADAAGNRALFQVSHVFR